MPVYDDPDGGRLLPADSLETWTQRVLARLGTPADIAADVAEILLAADRRGIASHGTARLPQYIALVDSGVVDVAARPETIRARPAIALIDAHDGWGHHASKVAVDAAIAGAGDAGSFTSVLRHSNHYGIAGWYSMRAAAAGLIGFSFTNTSPVMAPTRAREALIGTNPIAMAAPAGRYGMFSLDMATSTVPGGRLEVAERRGEALRPEWALDPEGRPTIDPTAGRAGALQPLGGVEESGGYKGYGLSLMVDILTGVLAGGTAAAEIVPLFATDHGVNDLCQTFIAIDPAAIDEPGAFESRMERELDLLTAAATIDDAPGRVLFAGEPEAEAERRSAERGVVVDQVHLESLTVLADRFDLPLPESRPIS